MIDDDDRPRPARGLDVKRPPLDDAGVAELEAYIAALEDEIARARAAIEQRSSHRAAAAAFFKS